MADILKTALQRFNLCADADRDNRTESLFDIKFSIGEQWDAPIKLAREREARPCLTINRTNQFIHSIVNDIRQNRPSIKVSATDDSTVETAEIYEGLIRHIQTSSNADIAYDTAVDFQVRGGFGYIRVITDYCYDDSFDQEIKIIRVKNPFMVYFDPNAMEPDYSDANYCFIYTDMSKEEFKAEYPKAKAANFNKETIGDSLKEWMNDETVRVAEYYYIEKKPKTIYQLIDGSIVEDKPEDESLIKNERETYDQQVKWVKMTGAEILEKKDWAGKYIPIVPVLGEDLEIDGKRHLSGLTRAMRDPQRMYNYWTTAQTEMIALAPKAPWLVAAGQIKGYEKMWQNANTGTPSVLIYNQTDVKGNPAPLPQRIQAEPPIQAMILATQQAAEDLKGSTGIYDAGLGSRSNETSGRAITARKQQGETANFHFVDNLSRAIRHVGRICVDLIPKIYDAPRIVRIIHPDQSDEMVKVNQPTGEQDTNGIDKIFDLTTGKYDIVVETGPSFNTKRKESADALIQMTQANPELWSLVGDLMVKSMDFAYADEMAERLKTMLPPQIQALEKGDKPVDPQVEAQMQQSQQMIEQLTAALNKAHDEADSKMVETASKERIAFAKMQNDLIMSMMTSESKNNIQLAQMELSHLRDRQMQPDLMQPIPLGEEEMPEPQMESPLAQPI